MKFARRVRPEVEVNLTPLIDVVFLLLIFFMVSTTFTKETRLAITLPESSEGESSEVDRLRLEITITRTGDYAVNDLPLLNNKLLTLKNALLKVSKGDSTIPLYITADSQTPHQSVVTAYDAAGQLGFSKLNVTTRRSGERAE